MISKSRIFFLLLVISLVIILSLPISVSNRIKIRLVDFLSPILKSTDYIVDRIISIKDLFSAIRENRNLKAELAQLSAELNRLREVQEENKRLMGLLDIKRSLSYDTIACHVIARDAGTWYKTLVVDKGKNSGICPDMPVLSGGGLIGRVVDCGEETSMVLLITDINSSIGGIVQDTRAVGLVEGDGRGGCILNLIPKKYDLKVGSVVVTSGFSRIPKGLSIGVIKDISVSEDGLYKVARLQLFSDIDRVEEVLVVKIRDD